MISENIKLFYMISCVLLGLIILSPTLFSVIPLPEGEGFSELWILGSNHMLEGYPYEVSPGITYHVFLDISNQMGYLEYYLVRVSLRNQSEPMPDNLAGIPSGLPTAYEYRVFLPNNATWENEFSFSAEAVSFNGNTNRISKILIDSQPVEVDKTAVQNEEDNGFYYELFFELWIYNSTISAFNFHNRSVGFWIKLNS